MRQATIQRKTKETDIKLTLHLDGTGKHLISTGVGFLDHMLTAWAVHGLFDLDVQAVGDLHIDAHHTIEDVGLVLGRAFGQALGDKRGITRTGWALLPMDETLAQVAIDFSGRPYCVFQAQFSAPALGIFPSSLVQHFFESFATTAQATLHAHILHGRDDHHKAEALFKGLAKACAMAAQLDPRRLDVPSSKGVL